jgi:hypothetical protein
MQDEEVTIIRFQTYPIDRERIRRIRKTVEALSVSQVIRDAIRHYEKHLSQSMADHVP